MYKRHADQLSMPERPEMFGNDGGVIKIGLVQQTLISDCCKRKMSNEYKNFLLLRLDFVQDFLPNIGESPALSGTLVRPFLMPYCQKIFFD